MINTNNIHPALVNKLKEQEEEYVKVTAFAELLPMFSSKIIENEHNGERYCKLGSTYGKLYYPWDINWFTNRPTNYPEDQCQTGFVSVYINTITLFGDKLSTFASGELGKVVPTIKVHFYDHWNSTFYFLPDEVTEGLQKLSDWFVDTKTKCDAQLKKIKKEELERQLKVFE